MSEDPQAASVKFASNQLHAVRSNTNSIRPTPLATEKEATSSHGDVEKAARVQQTPDESYLKRPTTAYSGWILLWLAYQSTGVIYGDIGTSPLYVYSSTFTADPSYIDLLGALSLIIWSITLMVSVKYVLIILYADDDGEGGTFALYSLLSRYAHIVQRDPKEASMLRFERYMSTDMKRSNKTFRSAIENSPLSKGLLKFVGVLGVSLVMADGVLTPAQSVLGAIQGIKVVKPGISSGTIVGTSCAILVLLFLVQPFGTSKIASSFAPIVIIWLLANFSFGIYNLAMHDASVLKAFSPFFAGDYLARNGTEGWKSLGGILLAFTGVEALFADLGAFSRRSIQLSWLLFAYPCLLLAYIGQAAFISEDPTAWSNPFFNTVPPGTFYPSLVISILAAVVASQAMITAAFQLLSQVMKLSYFPQIKLVHTSKMFYGQVYIPWANWLLMVGTVIVTAVYSNTTKLGNAYGVCVILVTFISTCMVTAVALIVWRLHFLLVLAGFILFASLDGVFLASALTKVPKGAWFTLVLAFILSSIFILWRYGKETQWKSEGSGTFTPSHLVSFNDGGELALSQRFGGARLTPIKGMGIFFDKAGDKAPTVFSQFLRKFEACPQVSVFFHLRPFQVPTIPIEDRYLISRTTLPNTYRVNIRYGYTEDIVSADLATMLFEQLRAFVAEDIPEFQRSGQGRGGRTPQDGPLATTTGTDTPSKSSFVSNPSTELAILEQAFESQVVYIVGKEQMRIRPSTFILKKIVLSVFLWIRENTRARVASLNIPVDKLVEVGFINEL